jgi:DNA-binding transcriptional MerR regulator
MLKEQRTLTISQAAGELYVTLAWVRFGQRLGSLPLARRTAGGHRFYTTEDVERLRRLGVGQRRKKALEAGDE